MLQYLNKYAKPNPMTIRQIDEIIDEGRSLKLIAQVYSEISFSKLKKIRGEVERNRDFFNEISQIYHLVKNIASRKKIAVAKKKKTVSLLLTSNYGFYGNINSKLIPFFMINTTKIDTDRIVIGKAATEHFKAIRYFHAYKSLILKGDLPTPEELNNLSLQIKDYNQVLVFYPLFKSVLVQDPMVKDITETQAEASQKTDPLLDLNQYPFIFEPELNKILEFFDSQIAILLLEQTFLEAELARTASRLISMDQAQTEANKFIKEQEKIRAYAKRSIENNRILENLASMAAFKKELPL